MVPSWGRAMRRRDFFRRGIGYTGGLVGIGVIYFALARGGLALASINPSATPIWPPTGFVLAAVLLWGYWTWPAIFAASLIVNATIAGSIATAMAIATGNSLEAVVGAYFINRWSNGRNTFSTPSSVARFALICVVIATPISPGIGVTSLATAGYTEWTNFANIWVTWWLGDVTSALVFTPVIVLWALSDYHVAGEQPTNRQHAPGAAEFVEHPLFVELAGDLQLGLSLAHERSEYPTNRLDLLRAPGPKDDPVRQQDFS